MKKEEAEGAIRYLCHQWVAECRVISEPNDMYSFSDFKSWLLSKGYSHYLDFRSVMGAAYDAEMWFDQELKQTWRR